LAQEIKLKLNLNLIFIIKIDTRFFFFLK